MHMPITSVRTDAVPARSGRTLALAAALALTAFSGTASAAVMSSHTFTTCGASGKEGPALSACRTAYTTDWDETNAKFNVIGGIQYWTVPSNGTYRFRVAGAQGGGWAGGRGAVTTVDLTLLKGDMLKILVGQRGVASADQAGSGAGGGGGGGTFVAKSDDTPLVVAGGGGGGWGGMNGYPVWQGAGGSSSTCGTAAPDGAYYRTGSGGCSGNGGTTLGWDDQSAAGGGFYTAGMSNFAWWRNVEGGHSFTSGGTGGSGDSGGYGGDPAGGFGGGGGSWGNGLVRGGGGGGWSGGAGATGAGGGGGSFASASAGNVSYSSGSNTGDGSVEVTRLTLGQPSVDSGPSNGGYSGRTATFSVSGDAGTTLRCAIDSGAWSTCSSIVNFTDLTEGSHTAAFKSIDSVGTSSDVTTVTWTVDTTPPSAPGLSGAPSGPSSSTSATVSFTGEAKATFSCSVDGSSFAACTSPQSVTGLAEGPHSLAVTQTDRAGNTSAVATATWTVDTTPPGRPSVSSSHPEPNVISISFSGDAGSSFACVLDGSPYATCPASPASIGNLTDGEHTFAVTQTDPAGNVSDAAVVNWTVDTTPPTAPTLSNGPSGTTSSRSASMAIDGEPGARFECSLDSGAWADCANPWVGSGLVDGNHTLSVRQIDSHGNTGEPATASWTVDATGPAGPTVTSPVGGTATKNREATFTASGEEGATAMCRLDGGDWLPCPVPSGTIPGNGSQIPVGWQTILHWGEPTDWTSLAWGQTNANGGIQWNGAMSREWFTDGKVTMLQVVGLVSQMLHANLTCQYIDGLGPSYGLFIVLATPDHSARNHYDIDCEDTSLPEVTGPSAARFSDLSEGEHTLDVRFDDAAGNQGSVASVTWTVDATAPAAPTHSGAPAPDSNSRSASIAIQGEDGGTFECSVDSGSWATCSSPWTAADLADGPHSLSSRQTDAAGNTGPARTSSWTVDTVAPARPSLSGAPSGLTNSRNVKATIGGEDGSTIECRIDSGAWATCPADGEFTGLPDGLRTLSVRQTDAAGNRSETESASWTIDATPPAAPTLGGAPAAFTKSRLATIAIGGEAGAMIECSIDGAPFAPCAPTRSFTALPDGAHSVAARQTDAAGNRSTTATAAWTVDNVAPALPTVSGGGGASTARVSNDQSPTFTFSGEAGARFECSVDSTAVVACGSSKTFGPLTPGVHSLYARQIDAAGNVGPLVLIRWQYRVFEAAAPTVTVSAGGDPVLGSAVSAGGLQVSGNATGVTSRVLTWQRCSDDPQGGAPNCFDIEGANGFVRIPTPADIGWKLRVRVSFTTAAGATAIASSATTGVVAPTLARGLTIQWGAGIAAPARNTGVKQALAAAWRGLDMTIATSSYTWQRCTTDDPATCTTIANQTNGWYIPQAGDIGQRLRLGVTFRQRAWSSTTWSAITPQVMLRPVLLSAKRGKSKAPKKH